MPKTRLGRWAGGVLAVFLMFLVVLILGMRLAGIAPGTPLAIILGMCMMFTGIAIFVTAVISQVKFKDHSIVVMAATVNGSIAFLFITVEIIEIVRGILLRSSH
jgi:hypothetical protein